MLWFRDISNVVIVIEFIDMRSEYNEKRNVLCVQIERDCSELKKVQF